MNLGRRQRAEEQAARNVRPRNDTVDINGYAFNVSIQRRRDGNPMYAKVVPLWRYLDTFEPISFIRAMTSTLKSQVIQAVQ
jgi:hypothetical protein